MDIGLHLSSQNPVGDDPRGILENLLRAVGMARDAGFNSVLVPQHYLVDFHQFQPFPLLGRIAAEAGTMRLGTGIFLLPLHHPVVAAENFATLSLCSERPVVAGLAAGYRDVEFDSLDVPKSARSGRLEEGIELMRRLWSEEDVSYSGRHFTVEDVTINPRPPTMPEVWIGANTTSAIERAARLGDAWYVNPHSTIDEISRLKDRYDAVKVERGEETVVPMRRELFVTRDQETLSTVRRCLAEKYRKYLQWGQHEAMEDETELKQEFDDLAEDRFVLGTPEEVCEELERYESDLDVSEVIVRVHFPGMEYQPAYDSIAMMGDEVIPYV